MDIQPCHVSLASSLKQKNYVNPSLTTITKNSATQWPQVLCKRKNPDQQECPRRHPCFPWAPLTVCLHRGSNWTSAWILHRSQLEQGTITSKTQATNVSLAFKYPGIFDPSVFMQALELFTGSTDFHTTSEPPRNSSPISHSV